MLTQARTMRFRRLVRHPEVATQHLLVAMTVEKVVAVTQML